MTEHQKIENEIEYNKTITHNIDIDNCFGNLPKSDCIEVFKDGRAFSHFIERWLAINYPLNHIKGCKKYDHTDVSDENIKYDQKTFTSGYLLLKSISKSISLPTPNTIRRSAFFET